MDRAPAHAVPWGQEFDLAGPQRLGGFAPGGDADFRRLTRARQKHLYPVQSESLATVAAGGLHFLLVQTKSLGLCTSSEP